MADPNATTCAAFGDGGELHEHHLVPEVCGGINLPTVMLCTACHGLVHRDPVIIKYENEDHELFADWQRSSLQEFSTARQINILKEEISISSKSCVRRLSVSSPNGNSKLMPRLSHWLRSNRNP